MSRKRRFDDIQEAITFAEAGEVETARAIASRIFPEPSEEERILAVSGARGFSRRMVEDCLDMAERLGFGVVALSVTPAMGRFLAKLGRSRARRSSLPLEAFQARAAQRGVPFARAVGRGDPERAVAEVSRRYRRIAFLLIDPGLAAEARFSAVDVPIFYLADA